MGDKGLESVQALQFVDDGSESTSVDLLSPKSGSDAPAEEPKGSETEEGKESAEETGKETDSAKKEKSGGDDDDVPKGVQKKIGKLTKKYRGLERDLKTEREKRVEAEKRLDTLLAKGTKEDSEQAPVPEDFETDQEYQIALIRHVNKLENKQAGEKEEPGERREPETDDDDVEMTEAERKSLRRMHRKGIKAYDDWDETVEDVEIPQDAVGVLTSLDNAEDVLYHLGANPDVAEEIEDMTAAQAGAEIQRLSLKLQSKKATKAPDPMKPVKTSEGGQKSVEDMTMPEYIAWRKKQDKSAS